MGVMSASMWLRGMRPRTLPASIAPVLVGGAVAWREICRQRLMCGMGYSEYPACGSSFVGGATWFCLFLIPCLIVALALQVAVNFANDYSDGIRGTDAGRIANPRAAAPARLVASGVPPKRVLAAAGIAAGVACLVGLAVIILGGRWWLLAVGVASLLAGWFYTGGKHPYGYSGLGEPFVFVFFGPVAVIGTYYAVMGQVSGETFALLLPASAVCGLNAVALMLVNNIRDISADRESGKRTYAARVGLGKATATFYVVIVASVALSAWAFSSLAMQWVGAQMSGILGIVPMSFAGYLVMTMRQADYRRALSAAGIFALLSALCWCMVLAGDANRLMTNLALYQANGLI